MECSLSRMFDAQVEEIFDLRGVSTWTSMRFLLGVLPIFNRLEVGFQSECKQ